MSSRDHHQPCPGGCGELEDECMTPGCGSPLGSMRITGLNPTPPPPPAATGTLIEDLERARDLIASTGVQLQPWQDNHLRVRLVVGARRAGKTLCSCGHTRGSHQAPRECAGCTGPPCDT